MSNTVIIIPSDKNAMAGVSTSSRKWIHRMEQIESLGKATEVESDVEGAREWEFEKKLLKLPLVRKPRTWTDEQKELARERLAGVRAAVKEAREANKVVKPAKAAKVAKATVVVPAKKKLVKTPVVEVEAEDDDDEDETEEVTPVAPAKKALKKKPAPVVVEEDDEDEIEDEDDDDFVDEDEDDEDEDEVVVKKSVKGKKK